MNDERREVLLAAYAQLWDARRHNDTLGWGAGAFLIAATFAWLAAALSAPVAWMTCAFAAFAWLPMAWWVLLMERLKDVTEVQADATKQIEQELGIDVSVTLTSEIAKRSTGCGRVRFSTQWKYALCMAVFASIVLAAARSPWVVHVEPVPRCTCE